MKKRLCRCALLIFLCALPVRAQDGMPEFVEIDSLFDEPAEDKEAVPAAQETAAASLLSNVQHRGFSFDTGYTFTGGYSPGWVEAPWFWDEHGGASKDGSGIVLSSSLGLDVQISEAFRVKNSFYFTFDNKFAFIVDEVYMDYALLNRVFFRAGKFTPGAWGISANYPFTNLLAREPSAEEWGKHNSGARGYRYAAKVDVPIGIGGVQALALVHDDVFREDNYQNELIGFGAKYNRAFRWADMDAGFFYQKIMPLRAFVSVKTTVKETEVYGEALLSFPYGTREYLTFSGTAGAVQFFFHDKLRLNGELFYNGEKGASWIKEANPSKAQDEENTPFIEGINIALNADYKTGLWADLRFLALLRYAAEANSVNFVPGITVSPLPNMTVSFAVPMVFGPRDGAYYAGNADTLNRPFAFVLGITFSGNYRHGWYD